MCVADLETSDVDVLVHWCAARTQPGRQVAPQGSDQGQLAGAPPCLCLMHMLHRHALHSSFGFAVEVSTMAGPNMLPVHRVQTAVPPLQVSGCKYFQLYPPEATPLMYPHTDGLTTNSSRVDARNPDPAAFPLYARARGHQCIIGRGEALYLPPGAHPPRLPKQTPDFADGRVSSGER